MSTQPAGVNSFGLMPNELIVKSMCRLGALSCATSEIETPVRSKGGGEVRRNRGIKIFLLMHCTWECNRVSG